MARALSLRGRWFASIVLGFIIVVFATRNLPWHLDDLDQAKQAFTSFEMIELGHWGFQHTPTGRIATKPPLAGWISAALFAILRDWDWAWRLPPFLSALLLLGMLWRTGEQLAGRVGALLAATAFGLNLLAPRLATLVRTDMMLTLFIFIPGWLVLQKVHTRTPWTARERWALFAAVLASMMTKGPIAFAFLLPGLAIFGWLAPRLQLAVMGPRGTASLRLGFWSGWWPWFAPLLIFGAWAELGIWHSRDFYEQAFLREFLGRFDVSDAPVHKPQPLWFYFAHLLHKWFPWSAALLALLSLRHVRAALRRDPALLWLACWAAGGMLFMSLVPSKRVDRIFPIIPPLCLLLAGLAPEWQPSSPRWSLERIVAAVVSVALAISGGYAGWRAVEAFRSRQGELAAFGEKVKAWTSAHPGPGAVVNGKDEGMLLYTGQTRFTDFGDALKQWQRGQIDWLLLGSNDYRKHARALGPNERVLEVPKLENKHNGYLLLARPTGN